MLGYFGFVVTESSAKHIASLALGTRYNAIYLLLCPSFEMNKRSIIGSQSNDFANHGGAFVACLAQALQRR
jgi:hypothetical protein